MQTPQRWLRAARALAVPVMAATLLSACASLTGPHQFELSLSRLQASMDKRFPFNQRVLSLFDVSLTRPLLALDASQDRVALSMDASVAPPFIKQAWTGSMALSGHLMIDRARNGIYISDARVDRFVVNGTDELRQRQLSKAVNLVADQLVKDTPLYTFRPEDLRIAGVQFVPTRISTTPTGLAVTFELAN